MREGWIISQRLCIMQGLKIAEVKMFVNFIVGNCQCTNMMEFPNSKYTISIQKEKLAWCNKEVIYFVCLFMKSCCYIQQLTTRNKRKKDCQCDNARTFRNNKRGEQVHADTRTGISFGKKIKWIEDSDFTTRLCFFKDYIVFQVNL